MVLIRGHGVGRHEGEQRLPDRGGQKFSLGGGDRGGNKDKIFLKFQKTANFLVLEVNIKIKIKLLHKEVHQGESGFWTFRGGHSTPTYGSACQTSSFLRKGATYMFVTQKPCLGLFDNTILGREIPPPSKKPVGLRKRFFTLECPHRLFRHQFREIGFFFRHGAIMRAVCRRLGVGHFVDFPSNGGLKPPFFLWSIRANKVQICPYVCPAFPVFFKIAGHLSNSLLIFVYPTYYVVAQKTHFFSAKTNGGSI